MERSFRRVLFRAMQIANQYTMPDRNYAGSVEAAEGMLPNNATIDALPPLPWPKKWPQHVEGVGWRLVDDHRERKAPYFDAELAQDATEYWMSDDTWQSPARTMRVVGPLPDGAQLTRPVKLAEVEQAEQITRIDAETSAAIVAGFDYEVSGENLHFSYDRDDQQNFVDTSNACILSMQGVPGLPDTVVWNAYRVGADGGKELVRVTLSAQDFLTLYTAGALTHKASQMEIGGQRKAELAAAYAEQQTATHEAQQEASA